MKSKIIFVTGTDTGVGKTVYAAALTRELRARGVHAAALKPLCSGGRADARALWLAAEKILPLDLVNPWHFRTALTPLLAARKEGCRVRLRDVVAHVRKVAKRFDCTVVEGAGGLLSPLGEGFDARDLIRALNPEVVIVAPNRLGALNQVRLVLAALPPATARRARIALVQPPRANSASRSNPALLAEYVDRRQMTLVPWRWPAT